MTDCEMVHDLSLIGRQVEIAMHWIVIKGADAGRAQPESFGGQVQTLADRARFEVYTTIAAVAMNAAGAIDIGNHGKRDAGIAREILAETEGRGGDALIARLDEFQFSVPRPVEVDAGVQGVDTV